MQSANSIRQESLQEKLPDSQNKLQGRGKGRKNYQILKENKSSAMYEPVCFPIHSVEETTIRLKRSAEFGI